MITIALYNTLANDNNYKLNRPTTYVETRLLCCKNTVESLLTSGTRPDNLESSSSIGGQLIICCSSLIRSKFANHSTLPSRSTDWGKQKL